MSDRYRTVSSGPITSIIDDYCVTNQPILSPAEICKRMNECDSQMEFMLAVYNEDTGSSCTMESFFEDYPTNAKET